MLPAALLSGDGRQAIRGGMAGSMEQAKVLGREVAQELIQQGADELIAAARR